MMSVYFLSSASNDFRRQTKPNSCTKIHVAHVGMHEGEIEINAISNLNPCMSSNSKWNFKLRSMYEWVRTQNVLIYL